MTTSHGPTPAIRRVAEEIAHAIAAPYVDRLGRSNAWLMTNQEAQAILVVEHDALKLYVYGNEHPLTFHGDMGVWRLRRLRAGGREALLDVAEIVPGDVVIDATAGQGADALVLARGVGADGQVTALESSPLAWALLHFSTPGTEIVRGLARRVSWVLGDHAEVLAGLPDKSADVVYFDAMFGEPTTGSASFEAFRAIADDQPLTEEAVAEAGRVARRWVVFKDAAGGELLDLLEAEQPGDPKSGAAVRYGRLRPDACTDVDLTRH